jgi:hypothetical protein
MAPAVYSQFINFLTNDLQLSSQSVEMALRHQKDDPTLLPMVLWQYGLVNLEQLNQIFDWLEQA